MPRRARLRLPAVPMHVIQRGNNRQATFFAETDYLFYLECLKEAASRYGAQIHAYVLMTNHVHLLASGESPDSLSRAMQHVGRRFVQYINFTYRRSGTLWEGRFKASLVESETYFLRCSRYIDCNPVRATMVADPAQYRWSSHRCLALGEPDDLVRPHEQYLRLGDSATRRQAAYRALFATEIESEELEIIRSNTQRGWPLGSDRFKDQIEQALNRTARPPVRGRPKKCREESHWGENGSFEM